MHSNVTIKNVSWPHFSWATVYIITRYGRMMMKIQSTVPLNNCLSKKFLDRLTKSLASLGRLPHFGLHLPLTRLTVKISRIL